MAEWKAGLVEEISVPKDGRLYAELSQIEQFSRRGKTEDGKAGDGI